MIESIITFLYFVLSLFLGFSFVMVYTLFLGYGFLIVFLMFCYGFFSHFLSYRFDKLTKYSGIFMSFFIGIFYGLYSFSVWWQYTENCRELCTLFSTSAISFLQPLTGFAAYFLAIGGLQLGRYFYNHIGTRKQATSTTN